MAKTKIVQETWTCDQCTKEAEVTARFTKDSKRFEVDLCETHSKPLLKGARETILQPGTGPTSKIRTWAAENWDKPVSAQGKLSQDLKDAYYAANPNAPKL